MAIAYKGFAVYYCNPTTHENLQFCRNFEMCFVSANSPVYQTSGTTEAIIARLQAAMPELNGVGGLAFGSGSEVYFSNLQSALPLAVHFDTPNQTGIAAKIKLVARNGSYLVSRDTIPVNDYQFGSGAWEYFTAYNADGTPLGIPALPFLAYGTGGASCVFVGVIGYDGGDLPTLTTANCRVYNLIATSGTSLFLYSDIWNIGGNYGQILTDFLNAIEPLAPEKTDPYEEDDPTTTGGGNGAGTSGIPQDDITLPTLPTYGYVNTGFFSIWTPTDEEIRNLAAFMWNADPYSIEFWKKLINNPIDLIIGLSVVPFSILPTGREQVCLGLVSTGVDMSYTDKQYYDIPCGEVSVPEIWGAYLDYNPYTKLEIFLPYIGTRPLNADEVVGRTLRLTYRVDIVSGACIAMIECITDETSMLLYHFSGSCAVPVPVTSFQMQGILEKSLALVGSGVAIAATGGGAIPIMGAVSSTVSLAATKQDVQRSGSIGSAAGLLDSQIPYLIFTRPNKAIPENQNEYTGYPSFITETLGDLSGYTEVEVLHLNQIPATEAELNEIDSLLKAGVIF